MRDHRAGWTTSIGARVTLPTAIAFALVGFGMIALIHHQMRVRALEEAEEKASILLEHNLAIHSYLNQKLKPAVFAAEGEEGAHVPFDPVWMSSTYAVREIYSDFRAMGDSAYYYKECAIGARNPANEADSLEAAFLTAMNRDSTLVETAMIRSLDGAPYYTVLRRGETIQEPCLQCHSTPDRAPPGLVGLYGPTRSFNRHVGEVVSAVSIRIPLGTAYASADRITMRLTLLLLVLLAAIFLAHAWLSRNLVTVPLKDLRNRVRAVAGDPDLLGTEIPPPSTRELRHLSEAFNGMSRALKAGVDDLEDRVADRTRELREALANVRTLAGLLPICSSCKKIRNDQGFWQQVEAYVAEHSEAEFSHGICPDCARALYPEFMKDRSG